MLQFLSVDNGIITVFLGLLALAAYFDVREYRIPNRLSLFIAALVSVAAIGALTAMGGSLQTMYTTVSNALLSAVGG